MSFGQLHYLHAFLDSGTGLIDGVVAYILVVEP